MARVIEASAPRRAATRRYAVLLGAAMAVVLVDQVAKALVSDALKSGRILVLLGGLVRIDYTRNSGAAFGILQSGGAFFIAVALIVSVGILVYLRRAGEKPLGIRVALGLILGGALGNLIDRVRLGYVIDFLDLRWWPVFNVADSAIVIGVALLCLRAVLQDRTDTVPNG